MKKVVSIVAIATLLGGCGMKADDGSNKLVPGYAEATRFCAQCHKLPSGDQHHPAAWPSVIKRMEGHIIKAKRKPPTEQESKAILGFFKATYNN